MSRTHTLLRQPALPVAAAALILFAGLPLVGSEAYLAPQLDSAWRAQQQEALSFVIADQGNRALQAIRAESRGAIRQWALPALPVPAVTPAEMAAVEAAP